MPNFIIEHQCPQCGAPANLEETDRLFRCEFCKVSSYLTTPGVFRYVLPHKAPTGKELIYFPYWRYKGMLFSCLEDGIQHRVVDVSHQAIVSRSFPVSLGLRSQTQKLRFATPETPGKFLRPRIKPSKVLEFVTQRFNIQTGQSIFHQAHVGETFSLVYAPFYLESSLHDAILNKPIGVGGGGDLDELLDHSETAAWPIHFLATLCPGCGWDLEGQRDSLALNCTNCGQVWRSRKGKLKALNAAHVPQDGDHWVYMPFWRIKADISHIELQTAADLVRTANLPRVVREGEENKPFYFWNPAFKIRPRNYLTFASSVTRNQPDDSLKPGQPKGPLHPVNLPLKEALESLKLNLTGFMRPRKQMRELINDIQITGRKFLLIYLPFKEGPHELINEDLNLAISKHVLGHAKNL